MLFHARLASSVGDLLIAATLAMGGIATVRLRVTTVDGTLAVAAAFALVLGFGKVPLLTRLRIAWNEIASFPRRVNGHVDAIGREV
jgi:hypothetical protein